MYIHQYSALQLSCHQHYCCCILLVTIISVATVLLPFLLQIAPYATVIVNGIYYAPDDPRLISIPNCKTLLQPADMPWLPSSPGCPRLPHRSVQLLLVCLSVYTPDLDPIGLIDCRLLALCDISADPGGSMEFMQDCTTIDHPFMLYDAESNTNRERYHPDILMFQSGPHLAVV